LLAPFCANDTASPKTNRVDIQLLPALSHVVLIAIVGIDSNYHLFRCQW